MQTLSVLSLVAHAVDEGGLPPRPAPELDPYLDAAVACACRYGWSRVSPRDIAREAGVERTTIYRNVGSKDQIFRLLLAREVHRLIDRAAVVAIEASDGTRTHADVVVEVVVSAIEQVRDNPMFAKLIDGEPELIGGFLRNDAPGVVQRFSDLLGPVLAASMAAGLVARRDPRLVTEWVVRMALSLLFAPPNVGLREFLSEGLGPLLAVDSIEGGQS